jgi:Lipid A 3-O-deacylase (PagL)
MGIRRNFVRPNWRVAPFFDLRLGVGRIDAEGPLGVPYAQGQDLTFTFMLGSGVRYNFNSRYAISAGINFMHVSNLYLSEPKYLNYGINVWARCAAKKTQAYVRSISCVINTAYFALIVGRGHNCGGHHAFPARSLALTRDGLLPAVIRSVRRARSEAERRLNKPRSIPR